MKIFIKNMVCNRCILSVNRIFKNNGIIDINVKLGLVEIEQTVSENQLKKISNDLKKVGFEIISDNKSRLIEQIKNITIDFVYNQHENIKGNFSDYLSDKLTMDYNYISALFSSVEGITIEKYIINLKTERVKELLVYDEKTLSEIAYEMGYSSIAHLSGQFKKVTGFTPTYFKNLSEQKRKFIDNV
ncbi:MAG: helix-turn-helix domain-containing protein [Salinivirgaceae bacterium]